MDTEHMYTEDQLDDRILELLEETPGGVSLVSLFIQVYGHGRDIHDLRDLGLRLGWLEEHGFVFRGAGSPMWHITGEVR